MIKITDENYKNVISKMKSDSEWASSNDFILNPRKISINDFEDYAYNNNVLLSVKKYKRNNIYYGVKFIDYIQDFK